MPDEASPWPSGASFGTGGLSVNGVAVKDLAEEHGTPLLVLDEADFRSRCRAYADAFGRVLYAVKAFPAGTLIRAAVEEGLGLLVSSGGELQTCLRAGAEGASIAFHGNNKSEQELEMALTSAVGLITVDNIDELEVLSRLAERRGVVQDVLLRIAPGVEADTHEYLETGGLESKLGSRRPATERSPRSSSPTRSRGCGSEASTRTWARS